jgi:kumamolisin
MARRTTKTPGPTVATGPNDGSQRLVALSVTSKNQTHPYLIHDGPVSDEAAWTVPELCKAYEWPNDLGGGGTIALIHLRGGWLTSDITKFFAAQGLAGKEPKVTDHSLDGAAADNGNSSAPNEGEAGAALDEADAEVALDIQIAGAAYAVATGKPASIRVYWAKDLATGLRAATADECDVCCITWGADEQSWGRAAADVFNAAAKAAVDSGMIIVAAAGDNDSSDGGSTPANVDFPASSPYVIGCGGTTRLKAPEPGEPREIVWNNNPGDADGKGTGGGFSEFFAIPDWQLGTVQATMRMVPDVAAHADPRTGYKIFVHGSQLAIGGTSAATALYAGLFASFGPKRGFITPELYKNQVCFNDIEGGDNGKFRALVGPDPCTGLGSPRATRLAQRVGSAEAALQRVRRQLGSFATPCLCQPSAPTIPSLTLAPRVAPPPPFRCVPTTGGKFLKYYYDPTTGAYTGGPDIVDASACAEQSTPHIATAPFKCIPTTGGEFLKYYYDPTTRAYTKGPDIVDASKCQ